jgi:hypothetical protein
VDQSYVRGLMDDQGTYHRGMSETSRQPWRTRLFVWLTVLAIMGVMTLAGGVALAVLVVESAPVEP